jgi:hypothetical protein
MSSFLENLTENIRTSSRTALVQSVLADPNQTIGEIMEALEKEDQAKFMHQEFMGLTIGEIVSAAMQGLAAAQAMQERAARAAEDDGNTETGPTLVVEEITKVEAKTEAPKKQKKSKEKKKAPPRTAEESDALDLTTPEARKQYEGAILKAFRSLKATGKEDAVSSTAMREIVGGTSAQFRGIVNEMIENGRVSYSGKARGTRYWLEA